ncbi:MAG: GYD domain-containing protein [Anaerolineales bacterium]
MSTYIMLGSYSQKSIKKMSADRTDQAIALIEKFGGKVKAGYAMLGVYDLALIVDLPDTEGAMKTSVALSKLLGVGFTTSPAVTFEVFDKLTGDL